MSSMVTKVAMLTGEQKKYKVPNITIPEGVTTIGATAFRGCSALTQVEIPEGVTTIGAHAFGGCKSLTHVTIPDGVTIHPLGLY